MENAIRFSNRIEHQGELVGGSFKIARPAPVAATPISKKASAPATLRRKSVTAAMPQPPTPAAYQWARQVAEVEHEVYAHQQDGLTFAPPPINYYQQPEYDYSHAPGGIAHEGNTGEIPIVRRSRPVFALFGMTAIVFAVLVVGVSQFGGKGGAMFGGMMGNPMVSVAGQMASALPINQDQAQPPAPSSDAQAQRQVSTGDYNLLGKPSISVANIEKVLQQFHSPAAGNGQAFYDLGVKYGIDPAFMLAFYVHESAAGTAGAAVATKSVGNIICAGWSGGCIGRFRAYDSYVQAAEDWYQLITGPLYIGAGLTTPDQITPRYAPSSDNNDPNGYAKTVERLVDQWRVAQP